MIIRKLAAWSLVTYFIGSVSLFGLAIHESMLFCKNVKYLGIE